MHVNLPSRMNMLASLLALKSDGDGPFQFSFWPALIRELEHYGPATMEINMFVGCIHIAIGRCIDGRRITEMDAKEIHGMFPQIIDALIADPVAAGQAKEIQQAWPGEE